MALACLSVAIGFPLSLAYVVLNAKVHPFEDFQNPTDWSLVLQISRESWQESGIERAMLELSRVLPIIYGFLLFAIFGCVEETLVRYRDGVTKIASMFGVEGPFKQATGKKSFISTLNGSDNG